MTKVYAGIGSRETPTNMLAVMTEASRQLFEMGWLLRSGHARGADNAFEKGAPSSHKEIHLPWDGYNNGRVVNPSFVCPRPTPEMIDIAARFHPAWERLSDEARLFMVRNTTIVLGVDLQTHADMVICWTPGAQLKGGTAHAMKVAYAYDIPVFNLADPADWDKLVAFTEHCNAESNSETV